MSNVHAPSPRVEAEEWMPIHTAPKGLKIRVIVNTPDDGHSTPRLHELPYLLRGHGQDYWAYAGNNGRVFPWHEPRGWLPAPKEWIGGRNPNIPVVEGYR